MHDLQVAGQRAWDVSFQQILCHGPAAYTELACTVQFQPLTFTSSRYEYWLWICLISLHSHGNQPHCEAMCVHVETPFV